MTAIPPFTFHQGTAPLLVSMPHVGTYVPPAIAARFTDECRQVPEQQQKSWYMLLFQFPGIAEEWLLKDDAANLEAMEREIVAARQLAQGRGLLAINMVISNRIRNDM